MVTLNPIQKWLCLSLPILLFACAQVEVYDASQKEGTTKEPVARAAPKVTPKKERAERQAARVVKSVSDADPKPPPRPESLSVAGAESSVIIRRVGKVPRILQPPAIQEEGDCRLRFDGKKLKALSNYRLKRQGGAYSSPLYVYKDGVALQPATAKEIQGSACLGKFFFGSKSVEVLTAKAVAQKDMVRYSLAINPTLPLRQYGQDFWWIFTKTFLRFTFQKQGPFSAKKAQLSVKLRKFGGAPKPPLIRVGDEVLSLSFDEAEGVFTFSGDISMPKNAWNLDLVSPSGGPSLLVEELTLSVDGTVESLLKEEYVP